MRRPASRAWSAEARPTTIRVPGVRVADDLVERRFRPAAPGRALGRRITYLGSWEGWVYLAAVQDAFSRRIVGCSMADHMRAELVVDALQMALARRRPGAWARPSLRSGQQGGFKRSSQRSISGSCDGHEEASVGSSGPSGVAVAGASCGRSARGSSAVLGGDRSRVRSDAAGVEAGCRRWSASGGFGRVAACRRSVRLRCRGGTCRSPSVRRSRSCAPAAAECARSRVGWVGRRRRSRGSWGATQRLAAAGLTTARRRRSGMPTGVRGGPSQPSSPPTSRCGAMSRTGWPVLSSGPTVSRWAARRRNP